MPAVNDPSWAQLDIDSPVEVAWTRGRNGGNVYTAKIESAEQVASGVVMPTLPGVPTFCAIAEFKPVYTSESTLVQMSLTIKPYSFHLILPERSSAPQTRAKSPSEIAIPKTPAQNIVRTIVPRRRKSDPRRRGYRAGRNRQKAQPGETGLWACIL